MGQIYEVKGNLLEMPNINYICNENNTLGIMGGGIALQIANKWNVVKEKDKALCKEFNMFGEFMAQSVDDTQTVINLYAQTEIGTHKRQLNYMAFGHALGEFTEFLAYRDRDLTIGFPKYIGCGLAGGNWEIVEQMLHDFANTIEQDVYIVEYSN